MLNDPLFTTRNAQIVLLASRYGIPAILSQREYVDVGGLMSYGTNSADAYRVLGQYTGRVLKGAKPAELPVVQSSRFEFIINLQAALSGNNEIIMTLTGQKTSGVRKVITKNYTSNIVISNSAG